MDGTEILQRLKLTKERYDKFMELSKSLNDLDRQILVSTFFGNSKLFLDACLKLENSELWEYSPQLEIWSYQIPSDACGLFVLRVSGTERIKCFAVLADNLDEAYSKVKTNLDFEVFTVFNF